MSQVPSTAVPVSLPSALGGALDEAVGRRSRALLYAARIGHIEEARQRSQDERLRPYRAPELCLHAIDAVAVRMDLESGATWEQARAEVAAQAARQHPAGSDDDHRHVAEWLLRQLTDEQDAQWLDVGADGSAVHRTHRVFLLYETEQSGLHHLRARDQAINVLVDALDLDIDSAQHAAEARLEHLIKRGRHDDAYLAARDSRMQSIRFMEQVRDDLREAERDLRSEHWSSTVSPRLSAALDHIVDRIRVEERLKQLIDSATDRAEEDDFRWIPRTIELLDECLDRHQSLQQVIAEARDTFLLEQQRQHLQPRARRAYAHPVNDVLTDVLSRQCNAADALVELVEVALGARAPRLLSEWAGVDLLAVEPHAPPEHGREVAAVELTPDREPLLFSSAQVAAAGRLLEQVGSEPISLATLAARTEDPAAAHALALLALAHRSPELGTLHGQGIRSALLAVPADGDDALTSPGLVLQRVTLGEPDADAEADARDAERLADADAARAEDAEFVEAAA
ncbi:hypothetical protein VSS74_22595 [Conexibacter stalactiti]|uniref:DUF3375 domain-containing protein n=1 Tax=Conexibacter stalactiti TaxID=1940611 RepID=A0ABU4HV24_9ACTN|nr:hypothetical protein [Conexibacter stalactiti]MDW5597153.1 hypothetical protein [Conexibacter stalactiti]MEC5037795.1 hypothetical protein [Conexibacter stalactiti]